MQKSSVYVFVIAIFFTVNTAHAKDVFKSLLDDQKDVEVTVYNSNVGLVKDTRHIKLGKGEGELRFMDVAAHIMPVTVHVKSLSDPNSFMVLEQNYEYDLMDPNKLMDKYVGRKIKLLEYNAYHDKSKEVEAEVMSNNGPIFKIDGEIHLGHPGYRILPEIPENLIAKPTLSWQYNNSSGAAHDVQVSYLTNNINWKADYILVLDKDDAMADVSGWVSLDNRSGTTYTNAKLKLIAGEINRVQGIGGYQQNMYARADMAMEAAAAPQFTEQGFFEYHIYDLQRRTTIKDNQTKQISLIEAIGAKTQKELLVHGQNYYFIGQYAGQELKDPVNVFIKFKNAKENNMGMPLPAGIMRLYKKDAQDSLQFIGEDAIEHTPKDEEVKLRIGKAFDVVCERKQVAFQSEYLGSDYVYESEWEITLRNHKEEDIVVGVIEPMAYSNWQILQSTHPHQQQDAFTVRFDVPVKKDGEVKLRYRIEVSSSKSRLTQL